MKKTSIYLGIVAAALSMSACGSDDGIEANLMVGSVGQQMSTSSSAVLPQEGESELIKSETAYSLARVDGLKLTLNNVEFESVDGSSSATDLGAKEVEIGGAAEDTIAINQAISISPGTYSTAYVQFQSSYSLKAQCRTQDQLVYTTAEGIETLDCASSEDSCDDPDDYDYYDYDFIYSTKGNEIQTEDTFMELTIDEQDTETVEDESGEEVDEVSNTLNVALLVDSSNVVSCYDGSDDALDFDGSEDAVDGLDDSILAPFRWPADEGGAYPFAEGTADFGVHNLPLFVWASTDPDEELPTGETYFTFDEDPSEVDEYAVHELLVATFAFRNDDEKALMAARSREFGGAAKVKLEQFYTGAEVNSDDEYSFYNGAVYGAVRDEDAVGKGLFYQDRQITGFKRQDVGDSVKTDLKDGPDCGEDLENVHDGAAPRACLTEDDSDEVWWKRVARD